MSMETPAEAIVGAAIAPAAIIKPANNAFREAFISYSFQMFRPQKKSNLLLKTPGPMVG